MAQNEDKRQFFDDSNIADDRQDLVQFQGIQPKNQVAFRLFKTFRMLGIFFLALAGIAFGLTFVKQFTQVTSLPIYRIAILGLGGAGVVLIILMLLIKLLFLRKPPFDDWVFEVAQSRLGTKVIFYTSKCLYINYNIASAKEVDKSDFVKEMSDKSIHYSYFLVKTFVDQQVIQVECTKRQPIPDRASFSPEDDLFWNIIPVGLCINNVTQTISPVGWYINDQKINDNLVQTIPSTSMLIAGGTGCHIKNSEIVMYNTLI